MLKFYWNGIKENGGDLQRAFYSMGQLINHPAGTITIYGRDYKSFSPEIQKAFTVENATELMTDYFEQDHIRVLPSHPLYQQVKAAHDAAVAHKEKQAAKREAKRAPAHDCMQNAVPYKSGGPLGHGFECGICGAFLQAG